MDSDEGPSRPKRQRKQVHSVLSDSDLEEELLYGDDSETEYQPDDEESASESEVEGELQIANIELRPIERRLSSPTVQGQGTQPELLSTSGSTSAWSTSGVLVQKIFFLKSNEFFGELEGVNPIDYFNFFFSEELLSMICTETNAQAQRLINKYNALSVEQRKKFSRITGWQPIIVSELRIFLGLLFHMGTISLNRLQDYWKTDSLFAIPQFTRRIYMLDQKIL